MRCEPSLYLYFTLPALIAALIGLALLSRRFFSDPALISTVVIFACFIFYKVRIVPYHFWMTRRFLAGDSSRGAHLRLVCGARGRRMPRTLAGTPRTAMRVLFIVLLAGYYLRVSSSGRRPYRVCRFDPKARTARRQRSAMMISCHCRVSRHQQRYPRARVAARLHVRSQRAGAVTGSPGQSDVRRVSRMGAHALSPGAVHRRRRDGLVVASVRRAFDSRANDSRSRSTTRR